MGKLLHGSNNSPAIVRSLYSHQAWLAQIDELVTSPTVPCKAEPSWGALEQLLASVVSPDLHSLDAHHWHGQTVPKSQPHHDEVNNIITIQYHQQCLPEPEYTAGPDTAPFCMLPLTCKPVASVLGLCTGLGGYHSAPMSIPSILGLASRLGIVPGQHKHLTTRILWLSSWYLGCTWDRRRCASTAFTHI